MSQWFMTYKHFEHGSKMLHGGGNIYSKSNKLEGGTLFAT
jgi:hypothetical protein